MRNLLKSFSFNILLHMFVLGNLQAVPVVGSIQEFNCTSDVYTHIRNGTILPVYFKSQLQAGDKILINSNQNRLSFKLSYEQQIPKVTAETTYTIVTPPALLIKNISVTCPLKAYKIQRNAEILPLPIWLRVGDRILVDQKIPMMKLKLAGKKVVVNYKNSPYTVKSTKVVSWWSKLLGKIGKTITKLHNDKFKRFTALLHNRGVNHSSSSTLVAPYTNLLNKRKARKLVSGIKPLYIAWNGGKAPYNLILKRGNDDVFKFTSPERRFKTPALTLTKGENYQLQICDAQKKCSANYKLTIVKPPHYPSKLIVDNDITAKATWLAAQNRKWYFEAYQQLVPLAEKQAAAKIVRDALEQGARIKLPRN